MKRKFFILLVFILTFQVLHIALSHPRYYFDMMYYLTQADVVLRAWQQFLRTPSSLNHFIQVLQTGYRPSFYYLPAVLIGTFTVFEPKLFIIVSLIVWMIPFLWIINRQINAMAVLFFLVSPLVIVYARYPMVEFPLYTVAAIAIYLFMCSDFLRKPYPSYIFIITVVTGMMIKFSFISFVVLPSIIVLFVDTLRRIKREGIHEVWKTDAILRTKQGVFFLALFFVMMIIFAGPRYLLNTFDHYLQTEGAGYWSYPYRTFAQKLWWILIAPSQIVTLPVLFLFAWGVLRQGKKLWVPVIFIIVPLIYFGLFMHSKGARMIGPITFAICVIASYGFLDMMTKAPHWIRRKKTFIIASYIVVNTFTSGFIPLDHAPAYEYPEGGNKDVYNGLTLQWVTRGGWVDVEPWENIRRKLAQKILNARSNDKTTIVFLYYTVNLEPHLESLDKNIVQLADELLWPEELKFPVDVFTKKDVFFIEKTAKFTHWGEEGSGLELERNLRFLKKEFDKENSIWRAKTKVIGRYRLPDNSEAIIYQRYEDLSLEERMVLYESFLEYDQYNGMNADLALELAEYYKKNGDEMKKMYWLDWIHNSKISQNVYRLVSKKDRQNFDYVMKQSFML